MVRPCKFGVRCYRTKNKKHMEEYSHEALNNVIKKPPIEETTTTSPHISSNNKARKRSRSLSAERQQHNNNNNNNSSSNNKRPKVVVVKDDELLEDVKSKFLVSFPPEFLRFWQDINALQEDEDANSQSPCTVFNSLKNLQLVGVFAYLAGEFGTADAATAANADADGDATDRNEEENVYLTKDRFSNDLPEMQTLGIYDGGRFAYWRDEPNEQKPLIVHISNKMEHFAKLTIIGISDPVYMIAWLKHEADAKLQKADHFLSKLVHSDCAILCGENGTYDCEGFDSKYSKALKEMKSQRNKVSLGEPFHGLGIVVKVQNDIGYRPLGEKSAKLKVMFEEAATTTSEEMKEKLMEKIREIFCCVQFANDEMDFGMGLEFGHNLFMANYADFDKLGNGVLACAYSLLKREQFSRILKAHAKVRRQTSSTQKDDETSV